MPDLFEEAPEPEAEAAPERKSAADAPASEKPDS
jgi:hypothetical protein